MIYSSLRNRLQNQHESISHIIADSPASILELAPAEGKWTIKDNVAHLAKYQPVFIERINMIRKNNESAFDRYLAENDPEFETWRKKDIDHLLGQMKSDRKTLYRLVTGLSEKDLNRTAHHKKYGRLTIVQWTEFFLLHEAHHIFTVFQLVNTFKQQ
jgi:hypothetical protein